MNLAVVVDTTPFTLEVNSNEFVEVEIVKLLLLIIVPVATDPPRLEVKIFPSEDKIFGTFKFVIFAVKIFEVEALVVDAFETTKLDEFPKRLVIFADKTEIKLPSCVKL